MRLAPESLAAKPLGCNNHYNNICRSCRETKVLIATLKPNSAPRAATELRIGPCESSRRDLELEIGFEAVALHFSCFLRCSVFCNFSKSPKTGFPAAGGSFLKAAELFACLISWLGACLGVRCPVWRLRLPSLRTRAPHKRAQHTRATQKENYGDTRARDMKEAI